MRLLLDENLSESVLPAIADLYPDSLHVRRLGARGASDKSVWRLASHPIKIAKPDGTPRTRGTAIANGNTHGISTDTLTRVLAATGHRAEESCGLIRPRLSSTHRTARCPYEMLNV